MTPVKAYVMGIRARLDGLNETFNPFRNQGLQKIYHQAWWRGLNA
jgi:hypothetical protein